MISKTMSDSQINQFDEKTDLRNTNKTGSTLTRRKFIIGSTLSAGALIFAAGNIQGNTNAPKILEGGSPKMPGLKDLKLFDSCVTLGKFTSENCISTSEQLISIMDRYYIEEALVHDYHARSTYPIEHGNQRLMNAVRNFPRLHPVWVLEPPIMPGRKPAEKIVNELLEAGVRAVRLRLNTKGLFSWVWEDLLTVFEDHRIPCFLDFGSITSTLGSLTDHNVDHMHIIVQKHPNLPLILSLVMGGLGIHPAAIYLAYRSQNLYLDVTGILEYWRNVAYDISPERVLFASGMPFTDPGVLVSNVQYALDLDENAKKMICGDNLRQLIGGVR
jgi:predicted TIM-barrel fold metal-dependent hydrolase